VLKQLIKYTSIQTFGKIITIFISLGTTAWLTRKLGLNDYGLLTFVSSIFLLVDSVADFGTRTIGVREISAAKDVESRKKIWINIALLRKIMTGVAFFFGLLMVFLYPGFEGFRFWSLVALSMSWLTSVAGDEEIIFQSGSRLDLKTIIDIVYPAGFFIFILIFGKYLNLGLVFSGYLLSRIISLCIGWKLINFHFSDYNFKFTKQIDWLLIKKILYESCVNSSIISCKN
jgi:O-antigen/teichoic acid export membrane protein